MNVRHHTAVNHKACGYLCGLGSFFLSRLCRIMRHFPTSPLGLETDMPLETTLETHQRLKGN